MSLGLAAATPGFLISDWASNCCANWLCPDVDDVDDVDFGRRLVRGKRIAVESGRSKFAKIDQ